MSHTWDIMQDGRRFRVISAYLTPEQAAAFDAIGAPATLTDSQRLALLLDDYATCRDIARRELREQE